MLSSTLRIWGQFRNEGVYFRRVGKDTQPSRLMPPLPQFSEKKTLLLLCSDRETEVEIFATTYPTMWQTVENVEMCEKLPQKKQSGGRILADFFLNEEDPFYALIYPAPDTRSLYKRNILTRCVHTTLTPAVDTTSSHA